MATERAHDSSFDRGHVVWHDGLFRGTGRPWLVVSSEDHPFQGEEYIVVGITTTDRPGETELTDDAWSVGGLPRSSYVAPWFLTTLKHAEIDRGVGKLTEEVINNVLNDVRGYLR